jgi:hypothetical protein
MSSAVARIGRGPALGTVQRVGIAPLPARMLLGDRTARLASLQARATKGFGKGGARPVSGSRRWRWRWRRRGPCTPTVTPLAWRERLQPRAADHWRRWQASKDRHATWLRWAAHPPPRAPCTLLQRNDDDDDAGPKQKVKTRRLKQPNTPFRSSEPQALAALNIKSPEDLEQEMQ